MKTALRIVQVAAFAFAAIAGPGALRADGPAAARLERLGVANYAEELAKSFEAAFAALDSPPRTVIVQRGETVIRIANVQSVRAVGSALNVTDESNQTTIVNPLDVLAMTEDAKVARARD